MTAEVQLLTISNILQNIRARRVWCILASVGVVLVGISLAVFLPKKYETEALVEVDWGPGAPESGSLLEGSLVGSFLGELDNSEIEIRRAVATIMTREFIGQFLTRNDLMPIIFYGDWDAEAKAWKPPFDEDPPTRLQGYRKFIDLLEIEVQSDTDFVLFTLRHRQPDKALLLLETFIRDANRFLHDRELIRSEKILLAVEEVLARSQSQFIHQAMIEAFRSEVQKKVFLSLDSDLPLRIVDRPVLPESPSWPSTMLILALSIFFAVVVVLTIGLYDTSKGRPSET